MPILAEIPLHGNISALHIFDRVDERQVVPQRLAKRIVAEEDGVVYSLLQRLYLLRIEIVAQVIAKRPYYRHIRVGVAQAEEILTAYPPRVVVVLAVKRINKQCGSHPVKVVDVDVLILAHHQCGMAHGTTAAEQIHEVGALGQEAYYALCQFVLTTFVG